jgi:hypothetical protein
VCINSARRQTYTCKLSIKIYNSNLYVKVICTSYDIPKQKVVIKIFFQRKKKVCKGREPVARSAPSDLSLISTARALWRSRRGSVTNDDYRERFRETVGLSNFFEIFYIIQRR